MNWNNKCQSSGSIKSGIASEGCQDRRSVFIIRNVWPLELTLIIRFKSKWPSIVFITRFNFDWRRRKLDISAVNYTFILCSCETLLNISHKRMVFSTMEPSINGLLLSCWCQERKCASAHFNTMMWTMCYIIATIYIM